MMLTTVPPIECVQARESASVRLDGELPELDEVRLAAHLRDCPACRRYAEELAALALELRAAPLEQPRVAAFLPRRRHMAGIRVQTVAAAAAIVAMAAGSSFAVGRVIGAVGSPVTTVSTAADVASLGADSAQQHFLALRNRFEPVPSTRPGRPRVV